MQQSFSVWSPLLTTFCLTEKLPFPDVDSQRRRTGEFDCASNTASVPIGTVQTVCRSLTILLQISADNILSSMRNYCWARQWHFSVVCTVKILISELAEDRKLSATLLAPTLGIYTPCVEDDDRTATPEQQTTEVWTSLHVSLRDTLSSKYKTGETREMENQPSFVNYCSIQSSPYTFWLTLTIKPESMQYLTCNNTVSVKQWTEVGKKRGKNMAAVVVRYSIEESSTWRHTTTFSSLFLLHCLVDVLLYQYLIPCRTVGS